MKKSKFITGLIILVTLVLAGVAIFTAIRLYQLRQVPVAPTAPTSQPKAASDACKMSFTIGGATATATATATTRATATATSAPPGTASPTKTATATATSTSSPNPSGPPNNCGGTCGSNSNCGGDLICYQGFCRNASCVAETDCACAGTPAPTQASLPESGTSWPTIMGMGIGVFVILGSLLLAL